MHYESTPGSGNFDTPIDVGLQRVTTPELDGYEMSKAGWHFRLQTVDPALSVEQPNTQREAGTVGFGGRKGKHWFYFKLSNMGYVHWPTRDITAVGGTADYSTPPAVQAITRNLGKHQEVDDAIVTANSQIRWDKLWQAPNGGTVSLRWGVKAGALKEEVIVDTKAREWLTTAGRPATPDDETFFSFRFEIDASDIPKAMKDGVQRDLDTEDFDDDDGSMELRSATDELLAFMPLDYVYSKRRGGKRPLRKRFYKSGGKNYLLVGARVDHLNQLLPGDLVFDPTMSQEQVTAAGDATAYQYGGDAPQPATITDDWITMGGVPYYGVPYLARGGFRFTPDVPAAASFTRRGEYAFLTGYRDVQWGNIHAAPGYETSLPVMQAFSDVASNNQPLFAANRVDSPEPGSNWTDSAAVTNFRCFEDWVHDLTGELRYRNAGEPWPKLNVSAQMEEVCAIPGWAANNGMRFRITPHPVDSYPTDWMAFEGYSDIAAKGAVLDAFYNAPAYPRTVGHNDTELFHNSAFIPVHKNENKRGNDSVKRHNR
jgi:hypothetical protein